MITLNELLNDMKGKDLVISRVLPIKNGVIVETKEEQNENKPNRRNCTIQ